MTRQIEITQQSSSRSSGISGAPEKTAGAFSPAPDSPRIAIRRSVLAAGLAIISLAVGAWAWQTIASRPIASVEGSQVQGDGVAERWIKLTPQPVTATLDMVGRIAAGQSVPILAPFDGVIREKRVQVGNHVEAGDVLVVLDTSELLSRRRDAESAYLKAAMAADTVEKWDSGPDVQRARRALDGARTTLASLERQVAELKTLFEQGIVSRNEYAGVVQQRDAQRLSVEGAKDDLANTEEKGSAGNRKLMMLDLDNTRSRLADLTQQMAGATVTATVAGIVSLAPDTGASRPRPAIEPGSSLTRGTPIFSIADTTSFVLSGTVDEIDVNQIKPGQPVRIASDAFSSHGITGKVVSVSAEASIKDGGGTAPAFEVRAEFTPPNDAARQSIRIGMSAQMTVETYANPNAILVPPGAIVDAVTEPKIRVRRGGHTTSVPVIVGRTFPTGVELVAGAKEGNEVLLAR